MNLYITADRIGIETGGGLVTYHESAALQEMGATEIIGREFIEQHMRDWNLFFNAYDPFSLDQGAFSFCVKDVRESPKLSHFYAGCFTDTVWDLKRRGCKITYTAAAHDINESRQEHEKLGIPYDYPHLTNPDLWSRYVAGYLAADVLICPSQHSANVMHGFGATNPIRIIPHGVDIPSCVSPLPNKFTVGYLGAIGPDKGLIYLLQAWKQLNYKDAVLKIAGRDSNSQFMLNLVNQFGGGNIWLSGWQNSLADFYGSLSLYVQPSVSEGFGIEVLEAMAHGRAVICSAGAGAVDVVQPHLVFEPRCVDELARLIDFCRSGDELKISGETSRMKAQKYTWSKVRSMYQKVWEELLA